MIMVALKLQRIGDEIGLTLPREMLAALKAGEGDVVHISQTAAGLQIVATDPAVERQMRIAEEGMAAYRNTLSALAK